MNEEEFCKKLSSRQDMAVVSVNTQQQFSNIAKSKHLAGQWSIVKQEASQGS